ncbi:hypothetical protein [Coleofasciculus sp.]|uniref:hypothetical protein n=1 Tax=Coleofasciculus sp. TaxID=3100458 RepID=UPI003A2DCE12
MCLLLYLRCTAQGLACWVSASLNPTYNLSHNFSGVSPVGAHGVRPIQWSNLSHNFSGVSLVAWHTSLVST